MKQEMKHMRYCQIIGFILLSALSSVAAQATQLVYAPVNPVFGGNPINGSVLLNNAQAENRKKDPATLSASASSAQQSALQDFNATLQRSILSRLASAATSNILGSGGQLTPGTVETGDFRITIVDIGGGVLKITTTDRVTGDNTSFQVGQ
jgi:curli production assembly/transport component CsgF